MSYDSYTASSVVSDYSYFMYAPVPSWAPDFQPPTHRRTVSAPPILPSVLMEQGKQYFPEPQFLVEMRNKRANEAFERFLIERAKRREEEEKKEGWKYWDPFWDGTRFVKYYG